MCKAKICQIATYFLNCDDLVQLPLRHTIEHCGQIAALQRPPPAGPRIRGLHLSKLSGDVNHKFVGEKPRAINTISLLYSQAMVRHNVTNIQYILPISLALHLKGISDSKVHENVRRIFEDVGLFAQVILFVYHIQTLFSNIRVGFSHAVMSLFQVNRDYASYFLEDNDYRDIREGRLTWMIAMARQRVSAEQREVSHIAMLVLPI
jgi:hypothetical protein